MTSVRKIEGVLAVPATHRVGTRRRNVYVLAPWREGDKIEWVDFHVYGAEVDAEAAAREMQRARPGMVLAVEIMEANIGGSLPAVVALAPPVILSSSRQEAGFPDSSPGFDPPAILRTPHFDGTILTGTDVIRSVGSTGGQRGMARRAAQFGARLEHILSEWPSIEPVVLAKAVGLHAEGRQAPRWSIEGVHLESRRTTLAFVDAANVDAEHGLTAKSRSERTSRVRGDRIGRSTLPRAGEGDFGGHRIGGVRGVDGACSTWVLSSRSDLLEHR